MHSAAEFAVIPIPQTVKRTAGCFIVKPTTALCAADRERAAAWHLQARFEKAAGMHLHWSEERGQNAILFTTDEKRSDLVGEAYCLKVTPERVEICANAPSGHFYGVQTFLQLLPPEIYSSTTVDHVLWQVPCLEIFDAPKYGWRSFMLDSGRQFQSVDFIKRYLDLLAMLKLNVFHWHLTEGQGWRVQINRYPGLTQIGSRVAQGEEQQGYYSCEDIREIVAYAAERFIAVVPEIDVPGHCEAALIAYPELSCFAQPPESVMGFSPNLICAGKEENYQFLQQVLDEICALFPGDYVHLGGDEAPKDNWDKCPACQKKIKEEGLKDSNGLQRYFAKRLADYLRRKGKKAIFWEDVVLQDGEPLPDNVVVFWWNSRAHGDLAYRNALRRGHSVICGTNAYCYLNYPVAPWSQYDRSRTFDLKTTYEKNPSDLSDPDRLVLGMACCLWTDWHVRMHMIDQRVFPRIYSLADQMWRRGARRPFDVFYEILKSTYPRLKILGVDYGPAMAEEVPPGYQWE
ncbi:MAG TPA: beta-N-acetylhexosaminidase [bacterium]|nr:beta-N-acetylhexosaminidase [bacterium]